MGAKPLLTLVYGSPTAPPAIGGRLAIGSFAPPWRSLLCCVSARRDRLGAFVARGLGCSGTTARRHVRVRGVWAMLTRSPGTRSSQHPFAIAIALPGAGAARSSRSRRSHWSPGRRRHRRTVRGLAGSCVVPGARPAAVPVLSLHDWALTGMRVLAEHGTANPRPRGRNLPQMVLFVARHGCCWPAYCSRWSPWPTPPVGAGSGGCHDQPGVALFFIASGGEAPSSPPATCCRSTWPGVSAGIGLAASMSRGYPVSAHERARGR
jgi:hypothetical protein